MTLTIHDTTMTSDQTLHTARYAPGRNGWEVFWLPGRTLDRNTTITAMSRTLLRTIWPIRQIDPERKRAYTTWLGKRYDRPAVPPRLLPLARKIAGVVRPRRNRAIAIRVRDILLQFGVNDGQVLYSLFAVLDNAAHRDDVRVWLSDIALQIPAELGVADQIEATTARGISLELIETAYSADVTQLTWVRTTLLLRGHCEPIPPT
jgi:hypothetical protein